MPEKDSILIVDDEPVICETLCAILQDEGYMVVPVKNGKQAIVEARKQHFDLALLDLKLPDMEGTELLHQLREINKDICAIIITAYPTTESAIRAIQEEAYEYITKPFDISHVKLVIKRGLEEHKLSLENQRLLDNLKSEKDKLEIVLQLGRRMSAILKLNDLVDFIVKSVSEVLQAHICSLMLLDEQTNMLYISGAKGLDKHVIKTTRVNIGEGICGWVFKEEMPLLVIDIENDTRLKQRSCPRYKSKSFLSVPIKIKNKTIGVINVADKSNFTPFTDDALKFLTIISHYAAVAIENAKLYQEIESMAITDAITGMYNHRQFQEMLGDEMARFKRYQRQLSLLMIDIDDFKHFNDTYGHQTGDSVLKVIAQIMQQNVRKVDIISRYGGEEFAIILPETSIEDAKIVAEKVRKAVEQNIFLNPENNEPLGEKITISGGIAACTSGMDKEELIRQSDTALYQSKHDGKNRIYVYKPSA